MSPLMTKNRYKNHSLFQKRDSMRKNFPFLLLRPVLCTTPAKWERDMSLKFQSFLVMIVLSVSSLAYASLSFWDDIHQSQNLCANLSCNESPIKKQEITAAQWRKIAPDIREELRKIARRLVNENWPDTILEGDYVIKGHTRLDEVAFLVKNGEVIGFWIYYSVRAWDISSCDYDPIDNDNLASCAEGRIYEGAFVHLNLQSFDVDRHHAAQFKPDK